MFDSISDPTLGPLPRILPVVRLRAADRRLLIHLDHRHAPELGDERGPNRVHLLVVPLADGVEVVERGGEGLAAVIQAVLEIAVDVVARDRRALRLK